MRKEKILLDIVTKDGSSLALQVSYLKFKPWSRIFLPIVTIFMVTIGLVTMGSIFSLFITPSHIYAPNQKRLAVVALVQ